MRNLRHRADFTSGNYCNVLETIIYYIITNMQFSFTYWLSMVSANAKKENHLKELEIKKLLQNCGTSASSLSSLSYIKYCEHSTPRGSSGNIYNMHKHIITIDCQRHDRNTRRPSSFLCCEWNSRHKSHRTNITLLH
jgi:hypothetical protein